MKGLKALRTISVNSSTKSNLKPKHLLGNMKGSQENYIDNMCLYYLIKPAYIYIYIYIYIYCHPQSDCFVVLQLFSVARHVGHLKLGSKPAQIYVRLSIRPLNQQANDVSSGIIRHYVVAFVCLDFCLTGYQNAQLITRA